MGFPEKQPEIDTEAEAFSRRALDLIEWDIQQLLSCTPIVEPLRAALSHMLFPGGKRIRPLVCLALYEDLGGTIEDLSETAIALELLHTSSLIHDDLPAMDNDDFRRGKPSCHKAFSEATAILAGDFLVGLAINCTTSGRFEDREKVLFSATLTETYMKLCNGQQLDMLPPEIRGDLKEIHKLKTGALFSAATKFAAIAKRLTPKAIDVATELGLWIGLSFQIVDDYLDVTGAKEKGRPMGSDRRNNKPTFFSQDTLDAERAVIQVQECIERCLQELGRQVVGEQKNNFNHCRALIGQVTLLRNV